MIKDFFMVLVLEGDKRSPKIEANFNAGLFRVSGISLPENPFSYYKPFLEDLEKYILKPAKKTTLEFRLEYFNTGSAVSIRNIIDILHEHLKPGTLFVKWYYEMDDIDILESGIEFESILENAQFEIIEVEEF